MKTQTVEKEMERCFSRFGIRFSKKHGAEWKHVKEVFGEERYARLERILGSIGEGGQPERVMYEYIATSQEAKALHSTKAGDLLAVSARMYEAIRPHLKKGVRVADLGCFSGAFPVSLAVTHPSCTVIGIDRTVREVQFTGGLARPANISFVEWDYSGTGPVPIEPCDVLTCGCGVELNSCASQTSTALNSSDLRNSDDFRFQKREYGQHFANWRRVIKPDGLLVTVLRIPDFEAWIAASMAAHESGWSIELNQSGWLTGASEQLLGLLFRAREGAMPSEDEFFSIWISDVLKILYGTIMDTEFAVGFYRNISSANMCLNTALG